MILDKLVNLKKYGNKEDLMYEAVEFAIGFDPANKPGKYVVAGKRIFADYYDMQTKELENLNFEKHKKYIDIQILFSGELFMGHCFAGSEPVSIAEYNAAKDVEKFNKPESFSRFKMAEGEFVIFCPDDYHMPDICVSKPAGIRKLVIKVSVDE